MARNPLISAGLEPVLNRNEKSFIASYYGQISTKMKIKITQLMPVLLARANKTGLNLLIFHFNISGKLSIIPCDNKITILPAHRIANNG